MLDKIITGRVMAPPRVLVYGAEGVGKSTFAAGAPNPIFIPTEDGLNNIDCSRFPVARDLPFFLQCVDELIYNDHGYNTVVVDSADWLELIATTQVCNESKGCLTLADVGYGKGYQLLLSKFRFVLDRLELLRNQKNMAVVFVAHAAAENIRDIEVGEINRYHPKLYKTVDGLLKEWADAILFATRANGEARGDQSGKNPRIIKTEGGPFFVAKNRYRLPETLPLSWSSFQGALIKAFDSVATNQQQEEVYHG